MVAYTAAVNSSDHQHQPPHHEGRHQRRARRPRRAAHDAVLGRLEGQHQAQRDGQRHVDPQDLRRRQRQRQPQQQRQRHGQHLAAVGGQRPGDDLADVVVHHAAFVHGGDDGGEVVVRQHHLRGLLGRLGALLPHGDAHVGLLERGRVVHAVARHGHHRALALQRAHHAQLVLGAGAGEHVGARGQGGQGVVGRGVHVGAGGHHGPRGQAQLAGDGGGRGGVVAGDHLHADAGALAAAGR